MSSRVAPDAIHSRISSTLTRLPRIIGFPPRIAGLEVIRSNIKAPLKEARKSCARLTNDYDGGNAGCPAPPEPRKPPCWRTLPHAPPSIWLHRLTKGFR